VFDLETFVKRDVRVLAAAHVIGNEKVKESRAEVKRTFGKMQGSKMENTVKVGINENSKVQNTVNQVKIESRNSPRIKTMSQNDHRRHEDHLKGWAQNGEKSIMHRFDDNDNYCCKGAFCVICHRRGHKTRDCFYRRDRENPPEHQKKYRDSSGRFEHSIGISNGKFVS
jgi:hypothetical protein